MIQFKPKDIGETFSVDVSFSDLLSARDGVITQVVVDVDVWSAIGGANDAAPDALLSGAARIFSPTVSQRVTGGVAGVTYLLTFTATTAEGVVRIKRGTLTVTGLVVPSAIPPAPSIVPFSGISASALYLGGTLISATGTEINYLSGVTSGLQSQLDAKAPLASPTFTGTPTGPTAATGTNTTQLASTAFVQAQIAASSPGLAPVQSVAGKTGAVALVVGDISGAAPLSSPAFTDVPTAPTAATGTSTTQIATTAFVGAQIAASSPGLAPVQSVAGRTGVVVLAKADVGLGNVDNTSDLAKPISTATQTALNLKAPLDNPTFTTRVTTPAITLGATAITATGAEINYLSGVTSGIQGQLNLKAPLANPTFTTGITVTGDVLPNASNSRDLGASGTKWRTGHFGTQVNVIGVPGSNPLILLHASDTTSRSALYLQAGDNTASSRSVFVDYQSNETVVQRWSTGMLSSKAWAIRDQTSGRVPISISEVDGRVLLQHGLLAPSGGVLGMINSGAADTGISVSYTSSAQAAFFSASTGNGVTSSRQAYFSSASNEGGASVQWRAGMNGSKAWAVKDQTSSRTPLSISDTDGLVTLGNGASATNLKLTALSTYADNAAATAGGLVVGQVYRTATGQLMVRY